MLDEIRDATLEDCEAIADIINATWPEELLDQTQIEAIIQDRQQHATKVAVSGKRIIGFIDGFVTISEREGTRWEVDLMAVRSGMRNCGVGKALIAASVQAGRLSGAGLSRALIEEHNRSSRQAFWQSGFTAGRELLVLFVSSSVAPGVAVAPALPGFVRVHTLRYRGVWLEPAVWTPEVFASARTAIGTDNVQLAGALIPIDCDACQIAVQTGYLAVGAYRWWRRAL